MDFVAEYLKVIYYWSRVEGVELEDHNRLIEIHCEINQEGFNFNNWLNDNDLEDDLKAWLKEQDLESYYNRIKSM